jgi:hypothetical protein
MRWNDVRRRSKIRYLRVLASRIVASGKGAMDPTGKSTTDGSLNCLSSPSDKNIPLKASGKSKV